MAVQPGWDEVSDWLQEPQFVAAMRAQANGAGVWAFWSAGAIHGTAELNLNLTVIKAQANGAAVWARWSAGSPPVPKGSGTLQLNAATAIAANFT